MNKKIEAKPPADIVGVIAVESYQEAAGLTGMPLIDRNHYEPKKTLPVAEAPADVIARPRVIVFENP